MAPSFLSRAAARGRRTMGLDSVQSIHERLTAIESALTDLKASRYPNGPLYFGDHTALVQTRWGAKMLVDTRDAAIAPWLVLDGMWEPQVTEWFNRTIQPGHVFVDVGANVGYFTLLGAKLVGSGGLVVSVEAHPRLCDLLHRNVVINGYYGYVQTFEKAAWSSATRLSFHTRDNFAGNSSAGSIGADALDRLGDSEAEIEVDAVPLDDILAHLPRVDVMKIDVEGAEVQVVKGLKTILDANPGIQIMFEWALAQIESVGDQPQELLDLFTGQGFKFEILENHKQVEASALLSVPYANVVATR